MPIKTKDASIETLRGLAILMVVAFHAYKGNIDNISRTFGYDHLSMSLKFIRMPLFTVISGFVYAMRPLEVGSAVSFILGKSRRLLVPLFSLTTVTIVVKFFFSGSPGNWPLNEFWRAYFFSYEHFWFLQAIFLVFIVIFLFETINFLKTPNRWLVCITVVTILCMLPEASNFFSFNGALYLGPFFIFGIGLNRFSHILLKPYIVTFAIIAAIVSLTLQQMDWFGLLEIATQRRSPLSYVAGISITLLFFRFRFPVPFLARIGSYSYSIYLFHLLAIPTAKRLAIGFGIDILNLLNHIKFIGGVSVPIITEMILVRFNFGRVVFLGLRPLKKIKEEHTK